MPKSQSALAIPVESRIFVLRQQKVILDRDLAELYGVPVKRLNEQVKRNRERFPDDFVFQLTKARRGRICKGRRPRNLAVAVGAMLPTPSPSTAPLWLRPFSIPSERSK